MKQNDDRRPTPLIIDTDLGNDIDDALALALAYYLDEKGECSLQGVAVNKDNKYSPVLVDILNTYYGKGNIEIGIVYDGKTPDDGKFLRQVCTDTKGDSYKYDRTYNEYTTDAVSMYRKLLSQADDNSLVIVSIGFMTNLARLLVSSPDEYSDLSGSQLVRRKVKLLSIMAGNFTPEALESGDIKYAEFNVKHDIGSARYLCDNWPGKVIFSGLEVGKQIMYPAQSIYEDYNWTDEHPVVDAYKLYLPMPYDRQTWDLTSVICAVRDPQKYFGISKRGKVSVDKHGVTSFSEHPDGKHCYLLFKPEKRDALQKMMREMCSFKPEAAQRAVYSK